MFLLLFAAACTHPAPLPAASAPPAWVGARTGGGDLPAVVAVVNGESITADELEAFDPGALIEAEAALAEARTELLQRLIVERLVHQQAVAAGQADDVWLDAAIARSAKAVTDADIERFYADNADQIGEPLTQVRDRVRTHLEDQRAQEVVGDLVTGLHRTAAIEVKLPRFRVAVDGSGAPRVGSESAPVQIVEFSDFQCPYCAKAALVIKEVVAAYGDKVSVTYRHFPLDFHPQAHRAAQAAACAGEQQKFWAFHDALFADRESWSSGEFGAVADAAKVDAKALQSCLSSGRAAPLVDADLAMGARVGASGTPAFFVNGIVLGGAQPFEAFREIIDAELAGTP